MRIKWIFGIILLTFIFTSFSFAATFQWLGSTPPESFVGEKNKCVDIEAPEHSTIAVGQGIIDEYGEVTDIVFGEDFPLYMDSIACKGYIFTYTNPFGHTTSYQHDFVPLLPPAGSYYDYGGSMSTATAISTDGSTVVGVISNSLGDGVSAFRWTESEGMNLILPFEDDLTYNLAYDVSGDGSVIVGFYIPEENWSYDELWMQHNAFIWDAANGWQDLTSIVVGKYGFDLGSCRLTEAIGISDDGMQIVGYGVNSQGNQEGWILTIPEPTTILLFSLGGLLLRKSR